MTRTEEEGRKKMEPAGNWMGWSHSRFACHCVTLCYSRYVELKHEWLSAMQSVDYVCNLDANERNCKNDVQNIRHKEKNCLPRSFLCPDLFALSCITKKDGKNTHFKGIRLKHDSNMYDVSIWIWNLQFIFVPFFPHSIWTSFLLISPPFSNINPTYIFFLEFSKNEILSCNLFISQ